MKYIYPALIIFCLSHFSCSRENEARQDKNGEVKFQLKDRLSLFSRYDINEFHFGTEFDTAFFKAKTPIDTAASMLLFGRLKPASYYYSFHAPKKKYVSFTYIDAEKAEMNMVTLTEKGELIDELNVAGIYLTNQGKSTKSSRFINDSTLKVTVTAETRSAKSNKLKADTLVTTAVIRWDGKFEVKGL